MSQSSDKDGVVCLANDMLAKLHVPAKLVDWTEISSEVFVTLYEGLCGETLPDVIRQPCCKEDEVHNCQSVIDALSMDILNTSLSHITGQDIVDRDQAAISNLLDVFSGLMEYILDKIASDVSSEGDADGYDTDPDLVTPEVIDSILDRELRSDRSSANNTWSRSKPHSNGVSWEDDTREPLETTADLIALGEYSVFTPPSRDSSVGVHATSKPHAAPHGAEPVEAHRYRAEADVSSTQRKELTESQNSHGAMTVDDLSQLAASIDRVSRPVPAASAGVGTTAGPTTSVRPTTAVRSTAGMGSKSGIRSADVVGSAVGVTTSLHTDNQHHKPSSGATTSRSLDTSAASSVSLPRALLDREATQQRLGPFDGVGVRRSGESDQLSASLPIPSQDHIKQSDLHHTFTHHLYHQYNGSTETSRAPSSTTTQPVTSTGSQLASSLPVPGAASRSRAAHKTSQSYENLQNLMRDTVEISRQAVKSSPLKDGQASSRNTQDLQGSHTYTGISQPLSRSAQDKVQNEVSSVRKITKKADKKRQTNGPAEDSLTAKNGGILSPKKNNTKKNVSFVNQSSSSQSSLDNSKLLRSRSAAVAGTSYPRPVVTDSIISTGSDSTLPSPRESRPVTFKDYLLKYYGRERLKSYSDGEAGYDSDEEQSSDSHTTRSDTESPLSAELLAYKRDLLRKSKTVRFDDILDDSAPGRMGNLRRKLKTEEDKTKLRAAFVDKLYEEDLMEYEDEIANRVKQAHAKAKEMDALYKKKILKEPNTKYRPAKKYGPSISVLSKRNRRTTKSGLVRGRKRSLSASPTIGRRPMTISDHEIMPWLLDEFPYLHLTPQTMHHMWQQSSRQIEQLSKAEQEVSCKKSKAQSQIEEAEKKQKILSDIMKKELKHNQRLNEIKERRRQTQSVTAKIREKRLQSARCRKYYEEYQVRNRSKMLKKRSKEELIFKKLFQDGLSIQKDRIRDIRKYARDQRDRRAQQQQNQLESLENYYKDQYALLMEAMSREREEIEIREKAQGKVLGTMKRELRKKMEREIEDFQEQLYRDEDEAYFRQLDADRLRHELNMARYQTKI